MECHRQRFPPDPTRNAQWYTDYNLYYVVAENNMVRRPELEAICKTGDQYYSVKPVKKGLSSYLDKSGMPTKAFIIWVIFPRIKTALLRSTKKVTQHNIYTYIANYIVKFYMTKLLKRYCTKGIQTFIFPCL